MRFSSHRLLTSRGFNLSLKESSKLKEGTRVASNSLPEWNVTRTLPGPPNFDVGRNPALDFVKGILVLGMIGYHAGVSFISDTHLRSLVLGWMLDFVTGSWLFVCGLLVTAHYRPQFQMDASGVWRRLWVRAAKMIVLFSVLNILVVLLGFKELPPFDITLLRKILLYGDGVLTSFGVLLGIGYVLLIGPCFLFLRGSGWITSLVVMFSASYLARTGYVMPGNVRLVICGLAGMAVGETVLPAFLTAIRADSGARPFAIGLVLSSLAGYYIISIGLAVDRHDLPVYLWGITSIVTVFYISYDWFTFMPMISAGMQLLGRYSLVSYLLQMALFRLALSVQYHLGVTLSYWLISLAVLFTVGLTIFILDKEIRKHWALRQSYRFVFG